MLLYVIIMLLGSSVSAKISFDDFILTYGKEYETKDERAYRKSVFDKNVAYIDEFNGRGNSSFTMAMNQFGDLTFEEFTSHLPKPKEENRLPLLTPEIMEAELLERRRGHFHLYGKNITAQPPAIDWRSEGVVTPVKNQGKCGSCWSKQFFFNVEKYFALKSRRL